MTPTATATTAVLRMVNTEPVLRHRRHGVWVHTIDSTPAPDTTNQALTILTDLALVTWVTVTTDGRQLAVATTTGQELLDTWNTDEARQLVNAVFEEETHQ